MGIITISGSKNVLFVCLLLDVFSSIRMHKYEPVTHVIFDLDGLLLNTDTISYHVTGELCAKYGKELTMPIKRKILGTTALRSAEIVIKELNLPITPQDYIEQRLKMMDTSFRDVVVKPGAEKLMLHLHRNNIPFAVATSTTHKKYLLKTQKYMKLFSLVDHLIASGSDPDVKQGKPAPDVFLACAERFKDQPHSNQCLVFEDSPVGVIAAVRAEMQVVMVPDKQLVAEDDPIKQNATLVLESLEDFLPEWFGLPSYNESKAK